MTGTTGMRCRRRRWSWSMCAPSRWASPRRRRRRRSRAGRPPPRAVAAVAPGWPRRPPSPTPTSSTARRSAPARGSRGPRSSRCRPRRSWWRRASPSRSIGTARSWWRDGETSCVKPEARHFGTGLYGPGGEIWAQSEYIPILAFALQPACRAVIAAFEGDVHPGDVFLHNDVFSGGNQNNDVAVFRPIFVDGRLVAWAATKGHQADIGGAQAGGYNPRATEVWQEPLRIPPLRVVDRGTLRRDE